jgi:hypothetical protein
MVFDYFLWLVVPTTQMLVGATIIVSSGIYVFRRERALAPELDREVRSEHPESER